jgi:enamine deaminase RidA (YjgF/YER057c/UK114 family)
VPKTTVIDPEGSESIRDAFKFSQAVVAGDRVEVSGQVGVRLEDMHIPSDMREQARQAFTNLKTVLEAAGSSLPNVLHLTLYTTDISESRTIAEVVVEFFGDRYPAQTMVQVVSLVMPQLRLEIQASAVLDD